MDLKNLSVSWVDFAVVLILLWGLTRGRKRGMSQELLDVFKWLIIVVVAGHFYAPIGNYLSANSVFSLLACNLFAYCVLGLLVMLVFSFLRRSIGQKLLGSDVFGSGEYYMGMVGGLLRYACVVIVVLSFLGARQYTADDIRQTAKYQQDNFGSNFFPTLSSLQQEVIRKSLTGRLATQYLAAILISPTTPQTKGLVNEGNIVKARERQVQQVLETK
jgi:uncharacterized membrane protein required for colicin V production